MKAPVRLVLFDLDDTLADTAGTLVEPAHRRAVRAMVRAGLRAPREEALAALREIRAAAPDADFCRRLAERFGAEDPESLAARGRAAYFGAPPEGVRLVDGAEAVLDELRRAGLALELVTFGVPRVQQAKVRILRLRRWFRRVRLVPLDAGPGKAPVFREILEGSGLHPAAVAVVGDRPPGEIRAGNELGMLTVRIRRGEFAALEPGYPAERADATISDLRELPPLLLP